MDEIDYSKALPPSSKLPQTLEVAVEEYVKHVTALVLYMAVKQTTVASLEPSDLAEGRRVKHAMKLAYDELVAELQWQLDQHKAAYQAYSDKTDWVQADISSGKLSGKYLGMHRADVLKSLVDELRTRAP